MGRISGSDMAAIVEPAPVITGASSGRRRGVSFTPFGRATDGFETHFGAISFGACRPDQVAAAHGAAAQVWAAVSDELAGLGEIYLSDCRIRTGVSYAVDESRAPALWVGRNVSACRVRRD